MSESTLDRKPRVMLTIADSYAVKLEERTTARPSGSAAQVHERQSRQGQRPSARKEPSANRAGVGQHEHHETSDRTGFRIEPLRMDPRLFQSGAAAAQRARQEQDDGAPAHARSQHRVLVSLLAMIGCMLLLAAALSFGLPALTQVRMIRLEGLATVTEQEIMKMLGDMNGTSLVTLDAKALSSRLLQDPRIAEAKFQCCLPNTLAIEIRERKPVAGILEQSSMGSRLVLVDAEGVAYAAIDPESGARGIPLLSGIRFSSFQPGQRLPEALLPLTKSLAKVLEHEPAVLEAFSEIKVVQTGQGSPEVVLYPAGSRIAVRAPLELSVATLKLSIAVLDILRTRGYGARSGEVDIREGTLIFRTKEAVSG
ncbi:MAG: FtsQ-type POTRA domain-containing protein [Rectinemataceae bacterium]|nr:FtsQ-type POTRA domain-containing protein [Spirochaetaceae bacterium]